MVLRDRRADVRAQIPFKIKYRILSKEEYEREKRDRYHINDRGITDIFNFSEGAEQNRGLDPIVIDFLIQLEEKIDRILTLLEREKGVEDTINCGHGLDISASGMKVIINQPANPGDILNGKFMLSRNPLLFIDVFGEIIWVEPTVEEGKEVYQIGVRFLDLQLGIKEKIISCIFQKQREDIRKMKGQLIDAQ